MMPTILLTTDLYSIVYTKKRRAGAKNGLSRTAITNEVTSMKIIINPESINSHLISSLHSGE